MSAAAGTVLAATASAAVLAADPAAGPARSAGQLSPGFLPAPTRPAAAERAVLSVAAPAESGPAVLRAQVMHRGTRQAGEPAGIAGPAGSPQQIAIAMLPGFGWPASEFGCLNSLWTRESNWNPAAENPYSGAFGIPQALPESKMASAGADWATNPATQIKWGLGYIKAIYGSPCGAWGHELSYGSY
jgi:hypothetical protein